MATWKPAGTVYTKESEWPGVIAAIVLIFLVIAIVA